MSRSRCRRVGEERSRSRCRRVGQERSRSRCRRMGQEGCRCRRVGKEKSRSRCRRVGEERSRSKTKIELLNSLERESCGSCGLYSSLCKRIGSKGNAFLT